MSIRWERWAADLEREAREHFEARMRELRKNVVLFLFGELISNTPVDTGEARRKWHISVGSPSEASRDGDEAQLAIEIEGASATDAIYIQNNVDPQIPEIGSRILVIELGLFDPSDPGPSKDRRPDRAGRVLVRGGFSIQAPGGISAPALSAVKEKFGDQVTLL